MALGIFCALAAAAAGAAAAAAVDEVTSGCGCGHGRYGPTYCSEHAPPDDYPTD